jgi:hypothetical protein
VPAKQMLYYELSCTHYHVNVLIFCMIAGSNWQLCIIRKQEAICTCIYVEWQKFMVSLR